MRGVKIRHFITNDRTKKKLKVLIIGIFTLILVASVSWGLFLYKLSKTDCASVTEDAQKSLRSKDFSEAYQKLRSNKRACSKDIAKQKTNSQKITTMNYEAALAKAASESGDKDVAKVHVRKAIDSLRKIDFSAMEDTEIKQFQQAALNDRQILRLDYELHKNPDGSYDGYNN